jgi:hypothetical protein
MPRPASGPCSEDDFGGGAFSSRRAAASQEPDIQVGTPNRGSTHFITAKYRTMKTTNTIHSGIG